MSSVGPGEGRAPRQRGVAQEAGRAAERRTRRQGGNDAGYALVGQLQICMASHFILPPRPQHVGIL